MRWRAGLSYGVMGSRLVATDLDDITIQRRAVQAGLDYKLSRETSIGGGAGAGLGGLITVGKERYTIDPGWLVTASWSRRLLDGRGRAPFLMVAIAFGASGAGTKEQVQGSATPRTATLYALDVRAALTVGKTFWRALSPYATVRAFGGPVFWNHANKSVLAGDQYHVQLGLGMVSSLPRGFDLFAEVVPLGERAATFGAGKSF
jgi:hypothetical protein